MIHSAHRKVFHVFTYLFNTNIQIHTINSNVLQMYGYLHDVRRTGHNYSTSIQVGISPRNVWSFKQVSPPFDTKISFQASLLSVLVITAAPPSTFTCSIGVAHYVCLILLASSGPFLKRNSSPSPGKWRLVHCFFFFFSMVFHSWVCLRSRGLVVSALALAFFAVCSSKLLGGFAVFALAQ